MPSVAMISQEIAIFWVSVMLHILQAECVERRGPY
jgi:hypothetical protein